MTAAGKITSARVEVGHVLRVEPHGDTANGHGIAVPARNLRDSVDATVTAVVRVLYGGYNQPHRYRITFDTADHGVLTGEFVPSQTHRLASWVSAVRNLQMAADVRIEVDFPLQHAQWTHAEVMQFVRQRLESCLQLAEELGSIVSPKVTVHDVTGSSLVRDVTS